MKKGREKGGERKRKGMKRKGMKKKKEKEKENEMKKKKKKKRKEALKGYFPRPVSFVFQQKMVQEIVKQQFRPKKQGVRHPRKEKN